MSKLTKEDLEKVTIPFFESAVDGQTYTVTFAAEIVANIRDMMLTGLRQISVQEYAKAKSAEITAQKSGDVTAVKAAFVLLVETVAKLIPNGAAEHPLLRKGRHELTNILELLSPEDHAQYRAIKYCGSSDAGESTPKADPVKRTEALVLAATVVAKAALVPGF